MVLGYDVLREAVSGAGVGVRVRTHLEPLEGPGGKIFPATYGADGRETRYAVEKRVRDGREVVEAVVIDSVASQANRLEVALLQAIRRGEAALPVTSVDFRPIEGLAGLDRISDFDAPHRIFDAILRDSLDGEDWFRNGATGRTITEATSRNAAGLFRHSPHTLVFGGWDSTGPRGGRGAKYERALTSEVVALGIELGVKTASRIDPAGVELQAGPVYETADGGWTLDPAEAVQDKTKPREVGTGTKRGRPSQVNHGNVAPSIDTTAGGVTAREIVATTVLSLIQLRRLCFPTDGAGQPWDGQARAEAESAARTALAALALAAITLGIDEGFDLRSRCILVPRAPRTFQLVTRDGSATDVELARSDALALLREAGDRANTAGLGWRIDELLLRPSERLVSLIRRSQDLAVAVGEGAE